MTLCKRRSAVPHRNCTVVTKQAVAIASSVVALVVSAVGAYSVISRHDPDHGANLDAGWAVILLLVAAGALLQNWFADMARSARQRDRLHTRAIGMSAGVLVVWLVGLINSLGA
jgi:hypothetical protein